MPVEVASQGSQTWIPSRDEQNDLDDINALLGRLRNATAPDPYVLTIPQDVEPRYHHISRTWADQWRTSTPFERSEHESLQYQTFIFHEHGKDMYVLQNSRSSADEPRVNANSRPKPGTGANTPNNGPKKKISLDAYKKKQTGAASVAEGDGGQGTSAPAKQAALKGPVERVKAESEEMLAAVAEAEREHAPADSGRLDNKKNALKREREVGTSAKERDKHGGNLPQKDHLAVQAGHTDSEPPLKKPKVASTNAASHASEKKISQAIPQPTKLKSPAREAKETGMPQRLSPGMPPKLSPGMPEKLSPLEHATESSTRKQAETLEPLPPQLSPTLPENIASAMDAPKFAQATPQKLDLSSAPSSTFKNKEDRLTPMKNAENVAKRRSPVPVNGFRASSSSPAIRSDAEDNLRVATTIPKSNPTASLQERSSTSEQATNNTEGRKNGRERLMVKLRFKRNRREDILRMLKLPTKTDKKQKSSSQPPEEPKPPVNPKEDRNGERKETAPVKGIAQKIGPVKKEKKPQAAEEEKPVMAEKRPAPDDEKLESPAKRKKTEASESQKGPATPARRDMDSPLAIKSAQQVTPGQRKDLRSVAMRREQSQDSAATHNTPPGLSSTPTLNSSSSQANGGTKPPSSQPSHPTAKQQAWEAEQKRLETLGRELKHAASAHLSTSQQDSSNKLGEQRLAAVKCLESFLCYLVAFTCADEAAAAAEPRQSPAYRTWRSLNGFFGLVKKTTEPFGPLSGLACTLGMAFNSRILAIATQFPTDGPGRSELLETQGQMQRCATDAEAKLDIDVVLDTFPKTWKDRSTKSLPASENLDPAKLGGSYKLPIIMVTPPIRVARAGHAMLREWIEKQKIDYTMKLQL